MAALDVDADVVQYLNEITGQTRQLQDIITVNNGKQDEIRSLRDGVGPPLPIFDLISH